MTTTDLLGSLHTIPADPTSPLLTVYNLSMDQTPPASIVAAGLPYAYTRGFNLSVRSRAEKGATLAQGIASVQFEKQRDPSDTTDWNTWSNATEQQLEGLVKAFLDRMLWINEYAPGFPFHQRPIWSGELEPQALGERVFTSLNATFQIWR